jgi:hypothetical protein
VIFIRKISIFWVTILNRRVLKTKFKNQVMKKVFSVIAIAAVSAAFVACGPSKADLEAKAKATADSLARVDSIAKVTAQAIADSTAKAAADTAAKTVEASTTEAKK